jgi:uncharacterized membrane protein YfcA
MTLAVLAVAAVLVGVMVGTVGVGGVFLAPALILIGGIEPHRATAVSLLSFALTGLVSVALIARDSEFPWVLVRNLGAGLLPGAFVGGWLSTRIPDRIVLAALCAVSLACAAWTFPRRRSQPQPAGRVAVGVATGGSVGLVAGFGSAVTGTSGPVLLTPALMGLGLSTRRAISAGQIAQVIVTPAGAGGYLVHALPDPALAATLSIATAVGAAIGLYGARRIRVPESSLRILISGLLVVTGALVAARLIGEL